MRFMDEREERRPRIIQLEQMKHVGENGQDFWSARELYLLFGSVQWRDFYYT